MDYIDIILGILGRLKININNDYQKWIWKQRNNTYYSLKTYQNKEFFNIWNRLIDDINFKNSSVIDLGCSCGVWSQKMTLKGAKVTGVDIIKNKDYLKYNCGTNLIIKDITKLTVELSNVNIINVCRVIMHLDPKKQDFLFNNLSLYVKKDTKFILIEATYSMPPGIWGRDWEDLFEKNGFKINHKIIEGGLCGIVATKF